MSFYDDMATVATDLITEFGTAIVIQSSVDTFNAVTGINSSTTTENSTKGIQQSFKSSLIDGVRIQNGDKMYVLNNSYSPSMNDKLKVGSVYWSIVNIRESNPAGTALVYFVQVRK